MTATQNSMNPSTVLHASGQPAYAQQDQAHTAPKSDAITNGLGTALHHFGDETGIRASLIRWSDGRLFLRMPGKQKYLNELTELPISADP